MSDDRPTVHGYDETGPWVEVGGERVPPTLAEFLLARIAEDEEAARAATAGPWRWEPSHLNPDDLDYGEIVSAVAQIQRVDAFGTQTLAEPVVEGSEHDDTLTFVSVANQAQILRWHPARVLAECEAKRRIVEAHPVYRGPRIVAVDSSGTDFGCELCHCIDPIRADGIIEANGYCETLEALALPYADHADYREEWRP